MDSPDNFSTIMLYIGVVSAVVFAVLFSFILVSTVSIRKTARQMLKKGFDFEKDVNTGKIFLYYRYKVEPQAVSFFGSQIRAPYFMTKNGSETEILIGVKRELYILGLTPDSTPPGHAYRAAIAKVALKHDDTGATFAPITLQVYFRPARNDDSTWTIVNVEDCDLLLEHPLMGRIQIEKPRNKIFTIGQTVKLISDVVEIDNTYRLTYQLIG